jgi:hypothetical protein
MTLVYSNVAIPYFPRPEWKCSDRDKKTAGNSDGKNDSRISPDYNERHPEIGDDKKYCADNRTDKTHGRQNQPVKIPAHSIEIKPSGYGDYRRPNGPPNVM